MNREMPKAYDHSAVENRLYETWEKNGYFHAEPNTGKPPYCIEHHGPAPYGARA